ncbi:MULTISPECIES: serine hydroxymethyltransferase [Mesorhizobium]|uniref:Serine hydroxymethyltransferase n=4 Tax=Mesorhizobium TaxID=68287 RepID=Q8KJG9_RHILI|nr:MULTISPECIES: serine hydroxymethyltransferase [Mesorhizobium]MBZ9910161.1 serine hydroxymethyltransferase [Mesorhizobium sp. BR115XR7A]QGX80589.1 serine hydroxymethyltransferase [Mesorhizobium japonicum R7A]QJF04739.1 serine hydroxymethyltransferase [Mesorhizobium japonicum R7A]QJF10808.1 serine hydroxymethyltransferase [Mesorhizobium japonicum]QJI86681.1 serine hydroxymethyltransferase [Mesorhizobium japonicum]
MNNSADVAIAEPGTFGRSSLVHVDCRVHELLLRQRRQERTMLKLIASENFASSAVLEATGSIFANKYAEGYPGARYYAGNEIVDELETLAIERLKALFGSEHANVQPYSGSPANQAVYRALLSPRDKVMGLPLPEGGHLTHGWSVNFSGTDYQRVPYGLHEKTQQIDYDRLRETARRERPKLIWVGGTAYPRVFDYAAMAEIAAEANSYLVADIAHISGLVVAGVHPTPVRHCDVVTSTSHKSIRGPRGGFILSRDEDRYQPLYHPKTKHNLAKRIDRAVFPLLQGGPHMNTVAALAVALQEAANPSFRVYGQQIVNNAKALAEALLDRGYDLVTGGTDNHMLILDLRGRPLSGKAYAERLARAGIITNFNMVPGDPRDPAVTSGIRLGSPAVTSMGMREGEMVQIAAFIDLVCRQPDDEEVHANVRRDVADFCAAFDVPGISDR